MHSVTAYSENLWSARGCALMPPFFRIQNNNFMIHYQGLKSVLVHYVPIYFIHF